MWDLNENCGRKSYLIIIIETYEMDKYKNTTDDGLKRMTICGK